MSNVFTYLFIVLIACSVIFFGTVLANAYGGGRLNIAKFWYRKCIIIIQGTCNWSVPFSHIVNDGFSIIFIIKPTLNAFLQI